jgi:tripartite-type tricarboxylate transporter receptor subunit TctC
MFKKTWLTCGLAFALCFTATLAAGQDYPSKPIRIVVPFAAGGASDIYARVIGQKLSTRWKQPVVIDNRPGAGGSLGADLVAKAPPDGYLLLLADESILTINPTLYPSLPYAAKNLQGVINLATSGYILIAPAAFRGNSLTDVIAMEKSKPGQLNIAVSGVGTSTHIAGLQLNDTTGMKLTHVPYKGGGAALSDVIGGQVDLMFIGPPPAMPLLKSGKVKALAVTTSKRMAALPQVPTVAEAGFPGFESSGAQGIFAPAETPAYIIKKLNLEIADIMRQPDVRERWAQMGVEPIENTPEQFAAWLSSQGEKLGKFIRENGLKPE